MRASVTFGRGVRSAVLVAAVFAGVCAASAGAKTVQVGQLFTPNFTGDCSPGTALQPGVASGNSYRVPKAGIITSWSWHDGANTVPGLKLKVGRHVTASTYKIVAEKAAGTQTPNTVHTYHAHIRVKAGDVIGVYEDGGSCYSDTSSTMDRYAWATGVDVPPGTTTPFDPLTNGKFPVAVRVSLDCVVPNLKDKSLKAAKQALKANSCTLGKVNGPKTGTVKSQKPAAGTTLKPGAKVNVRLG